MPTRTFTPEPKVENKFHPQGLSPHTRGCLRRLFIFSIIGLAVAVGGTDKVAVNGFISGISVPATHIASFIILGILYYGFLSISAYRRDIPGLNSAGNHWEYWLSSVNRGVYSLLNNYTQMTEAIERNDSKLAISLLPQIETLEGSKSAAVKTMEWATARIDRANKLELFLIRVEFWTPLLAGSITLFMLYNFLTYNLA